MAVEPRVAVCSTVGASRGVDAAAAAVAVAFEVDRRDGPGALVLDLRRSPRTYRGTILASGSARAIEARAREHPGLRAAARGRVCFAWAGENGSDEYVDRAGFLNGVVDGDLDAGLVAVLCDPVDFRALIEACRGRRLSVLLKGAVGCGAALISLLAAELREEGVPCKAWLPAIGPVGARRALAGLEPGGASGAKAARLQRALLGRGGTAGAAAVRAGIGLRAERAQALPAVLGIAVLIVAMALILLAVGSAATAKGRLQRSADLAAISAARSMHDDFPRVLMPAALADGTPNPAHLERDRYLARAEAAAEIAAGRNGIDPALVDVAFPDAASFAPMRVTVGIEAPITVGEGGERVLPDAPTTRVRARAEVTPVSTSDVVSQPAMAEGGGYAGPLAYRQGKPMRPDVAEAFDRMAAAARSAGVLLVINSAFRSDAEQQRLWDANPDPRWVAPPGTSLHRCGTELDLGTPAAYGWLAAHASQFGFIRRYPWEPWHFGFDGGPAPCSEAGDAVAGGDNSGDGDGGASAGQGLPGFVPTRFRAPLLAASSRYDVSAGLLAAQLMAESNFNPAAVSPAGAQGIAQFMPATAAAYGLHDPFDAVAAIDAQARLMAELLAQFGAVDLALAAYNAGPGAVAACDCVPSYPETQGYVARILGLLDGAGELMGPPPLLEVRLVG